MKATVRAEARIASAHNVLVAPTTLELKRSIPDFSGTVIRTNDIRSVGLADLAGKSVYVCGDISQFNADALGAAERVFVIRELSHGYDEKHDGKSWTLVHLGRVPVFVHGVGIYYRRFFELHSDYFHRICAEHTFQSLTESNKPEKAHRTGLYLTPVEQSGEELHFRLLRCSTNLSGPTENFRETDREIVNALNREAAAIFEDPAPLNHVLAQIYNNSRAGRGQKQAKAKISSHADKTKDMPTNGIMAFCTFYDQLDKLRPLTKDALDPDYFDYGYKGVSGLTKLHFRLKAAVLESPECNLPPQFTLTLYPNSVFFMPLSTNRLYTHEIRASTLDAELIPTRLGYVVRCSNAEAVHKDGHTFLKLNGKLVQLAPPSDEGMNELRRLYAEENKSPGFIDYGENILFSMNGGDYSAPRV
ncbi:MAG TPA: hypothetical protein VFQ61_00555 [Polyangiaceae bacterium]|nr:hypothetical protein [Polyangiaceae bacterium]